MNTKWLLIITALISSVVLVMHLLSPRSSDTSPTLAIINVHVIPMTEEIVIRDQMILISSDRITSIAPTDVSTIPSDIEIVDGGGRYVIPGLWDMHVHSMHNVEDSFERVFPLFISNGITGIRDMGAPFDNALQVKSRLDGTPNEIAPHIYRSGPIIDGTFKPWYGDLPLIIETPGEASAELNRLRQSGMDFFKVYDDLSRETYLEIASISKELDMPFAGHIPFKITWAEAAEAGQLTAEHLNIWSLKDCVEDPLDWFNRWIDAKFVQGYQVYYEFVHEFWDVVDWEICNSGFDSMASHDTYFTPTLDMEIADRGRLDVNAVQYLPDDIQEWCTSTLDGIDQADERLRESAYQLQFDLLMNARDAGVKILAGSDSPNNCLAPGFSLHWELALLNEAGMTPYEALRAATIDAAEVLGFAGKSGVIGENAWADLVFLDANPLEDIQNTNSISGVLSQGRFFSIQELNGLKEQALAYLQSQSDE